MSNRCGQTLEIRSAVDTTTATAGENRAVKETFLLGWSRCARARARRERPRRRFQFPVMWSYIGGLAGGETSRRSWTRQTALHPAPPPPYCCCRGRTSEIKLKTDVAEVAERERERESDGYSAERATTTLGIPASGPPARFYFPGSREACVSNPYVRVAPSYPKISSDLSPCPFCVFLSFSLARAAQPRQRRLLLNSLGFGSIHREFLPHPDGELDEVGAKMFSRGGSREGRRGRGNSRGLENIVPRVFADILYVWNDIFARVFV